MKTHICVLICYLNYDHIKQCFNSIQTDYTDFFIIENKSENSHLIEPLFKQDNVIGYIQFEKNITNNAVNIFLRDYFSILQRYKYITFSDCDIFVGDIQSTNKEIFKNLHLPNVGISCVDLSLDNFPTLPGFSKWKELPSVVTSEYIECATGVQLMTLLNENLFLLENVHFKDHLLHRILKRYGLKWVKTLNSKAYHLTWDLYYEGNPYYHFKREKGQKKLWHHREYCNYKILRKIK